LKFIQFPFERHIVSWPCKPEKWSKWPSKKKKKKKVVDAIITETEILPESKIFVGAEHVAALWADICLYYVL
jgi:hypothetical protein